MWIVLELWSRKVLGHSWRIFEDQNIKRNAGSGVPEIEDLEETRALGGDGAKVIHGLL